MTGPIKTGGTAFPMQDQQAIHAYAVSRIANIPADQVEERDRIYLAARGEAVGGMTLRDYFAAKAMQAHIIASFQDLSVAFKNTPEEVIPIFAKAAYETADAMLKAREAHP